MHELSCKRLFNYYVFPDLRYGIRYIVSEIMQAAPS